MVTGDGPCVCLVAIQGRVEWRGWARLITPVLGIQNAASKLSLKARDSMG